MKISLSINSIPNNLNISKGYNRPDINKELAKSYSYLPSHTIVKFIQPVHFSDILKYKAFYILNNYDLNWTEGSRITYVQECVDMTLHYKNKSYKGICQSLVWKDKEFKQNVVGISVKILKRLLDEYQFVISDKATSDIGRKLLLHAIRVLKDSIYIYIVDTDSRENSSNLTQVVLVKFDDLLKLEGEIWGVDEVSFYRRILISKTKLFQST